MDNSWDYADGDGQGEIKMGQALRDGYRQKVFLMTKVDGRTKAAAKQMDESLKRLQADHVDLMQFHEVIPMEVADRFFAEGGAVEAFVDVRHAGKIQYIGFKGGTRTRRCICGCWTWRGRWAFFRCRAGSLEPDGLELP